jgi:hypothetical protein
MVRCLAAYGLLSLASVVSAATVSLSSTPTSASTFGQQVTLNATISSGGGSSVTFYDGDTILGIDTPSSVTATIKTILLMPGKHSLRARYNGSPAAVSPLLHFTVTANAGSVLNVTSPLTAGTNPFSVVVGDFDGDGDADLAVANHGDGTVDIFLGNGKGKFKLKGSPYLVGGTPTSIATGYFHGNDKVDLVVTDGKSNVVLMTGNGDGTFKPPVVVATGTTPYAVAVGDFNRDGKSDIAVVNNTAGSMTVFLGSGNGTFSEKTSLAAGSSPRAIAVGDINEDGVPDLVVADPFSMNINVLYGIGDGTFDAAVPYPAGASQSPSGIALGKFGPGDDIDIAASSLSSDVSFFSNTTGSLGIPALLPTGGYNSFALAAGDFNGDSKLDLVVANAYSDNIGILTGNGDGTFQPPVDFPVGSLPVSLAIGDFNGDGIPDVAVANEMGGISILLGSAYNIAKDGGDAQSASVNALFLSPLQVLVTDSLAMPALGVPVTFTAPATGPSATFSGSASTTDFTLGGGLATSAVPLANSIAGGPYTVTAQVGYGPSVKFKLTNTPVPTITATSGTPQSAPVTTAFSVPLQVRVADALGSPVGARVPVTFSAPVSGPSGTFVGGGAVLTGAGGMAAVVFTANTIAGSYTVTATTPSAPAPATFSLTNTAGTPYSIVATSGSGQHASVNATFPNPLVVTVKDQYKNLVPNAIVTFTPPMAGPSGTFATTNTATTNASGVATSTVFTANGNTGTYSVSASVASVSTTLNLTNTGGIVLLTGVTVSPGQSVAFPVTLGTNALSGVTITLKSGDTTKATVFPASVYIPPGTNGSLVIAKVMGVNYGTVSITASASGYASVGQAVNVVGSLSFSPPNPTIIGTATDTLTLTLNTLAPAGGVTINLSSSTGSASVPATVKIAAYTKSVGVPVTGVTPGPAVITASLSPYIPDATANVTVSP